MPSAILEAFLKHLKQIHLAARFPEKLWAGFSFTSLFTVFKVASITFLSHFSGRWRHSKMSLEAVGVGLSMRAWDAVNQC